MKLIGSSGKRVNNKKGSSAPANQDYYNDNRQSHSGTRQPAGSRSTGHKDVPSIARESNYARSSVGTAYKGEQFEQYTELMMDDQDMSYYTLENNRRRVKSKKRRRFWTTFICLISALAAVYLICVYSSIPFIKKWRTLYIETAMGTMTHQWLATYFIPRSVIDDVMKTADQLELDQADLESDWGNDGNTVNTVLPAIQKPDEDNQAADDDADANDEEETPFWEDPESEFCQTYTEIDIASFASYAEEHGDDMYDENGYLFIDNADVGSDGTSIKTVEGDQVIALDTVHGITIARISGDGYEGVIAIVKDPAQVGVATAANLGSVGQHIEGIAEDNDAILAINASGFEDDDGHGNGGTVYGLLVVNGERLNPTGWSNYKAIWFDYNNLLNVGRYDADKEMRDAVEFKPALIVNGEKVISGSAGWGIQPRSAIGQTEDGQVIFMCVDGRQTHSIGITVGEMADIFAEYGVVQACNLDGGSSAILWFNGRKITSPSAADKANGRYLPDAFVVYANRNATDDDDID